MLQHENSSTTVSVGNAVILHRNHGGLIGVIHKIYPDKTQSTLLFYNDGKVHEATGFNVQDQESLICLGEIIALIPGGYNWLGVVEMLSEVTPKDQPEFFTFSFSGKIRDMIQDTSLGYPVFDSYIERIYIEDLGKVYDSETLS